jgi:hypothetical protein
VKTVKSSANRIRNASDLGAEYLGIVRSGAQFFLVDHGHGYDVLGVGGMPGMVVGGPGMPSGPGTPAITVGGVPGVPGV